MITSSRCVRSTKPAVTWVAEEIEALKLQIAILPTRAYVSRLALMEAATIWVLIAT
jgi:hypothetical protein